MVLKTKVFKEPLALGDIDCLLSRDTRSTPNGVEVQIMREETSLPHDALLVMLVGFDVRIAAF